MSKETNQPVDVQIIPDKPGSILAISKISNSREKTMEVLHRKVAAKMRRSRLKAINEISSFARLEMAIKNTRARIQEKKETATIGEFNAPVNLDWNVVIKGAQKAPVLNGAIPAPYAMS